MSKAELEQLEREAEAARARLIGGLERLRANDQLSNIQRRVSADVAQGQGELIGQAKSSVLEGIKARVAANPGAALAIGAGLAWRLYHHPPVASVLVGAGLVSLLRTDPERPQAGSQMAARAADLADSARHKVEAWSSDAAAQAGELAEAAKEQAGAISESVREWSSEAGDQTRRRVRQAARAADRWTASGRRAVYRAVPESDRDRYLLGAAAVALAAAVGIAAQRRSGETEVVGARRRSSAIGGGPDAIARADRRRQRRQSEEDPEGVLISS